jgi:hypothetical protein
MSPFWGKDGSGPTIRATSNPDFCITQEEMDAYDRKMAEIE